MSTIESLEREIRDLEAISERQDAVNRINNLVNKYEYMLPAGFYEEVVELFAQKTPGVSLELMSSGVFEGVEGARRFYCDVHKFMQGDRNIQMHPGILTVSANTTPIIEVAGDGKTAKGLWLNPSFGVIPAGEDKLKGFWFWTKRAYDFVKEDGEWKIWHYRVYGIFATFYETSWVDLENSNWLWDASNEATEHLRLPDKPTSYHWVYNPKRAVDYIPQVPEPYETFDKTFSYSS